MESDYADKKAGLHTCLPAGRDICVICGFKSV